MQAKKDMPKRYHLNRPDLAQAVAVELRTCRDVKSQQRLLAARLAASGQLTAAQIAEQLGISRRRFFDWMNRLKGGSRLLERSRGERCRKEGAGGIAIGPLEAGQRDSALAASGAWGRVEAGGRVLLAGKIGRGLESAAQDPRAKRRGGRRSVPAHALRTVGELERGWWQTGAPLWVADEHRYGLIPVVRQCWTLRGVRPTVPYRTKYEWGYLYSVLEVDGQNAAEFLCLPEVSLEMSGWFLQHLAASDPDAEHIAIWDQAGFHPKPKLHAVPAGFRFQAAGDQVSLAATI